MDGGMEGGTGKWAKGEEGMKAAGASAIHWQREAGDIDIVIAGQAADGQQEHACCGTQRNGHS